MSPTQEGERLLGYARRMLALHDEAVQALKPSQLAGRTCGLAVTLLVESTAPPGWRRLGPDDGFPHLPEVRIALRQSSSPSVAARRLAAVLADELATGSPRGAA